MEIQRIKTNGIELQVAAMGPKDGELLILLHGFPETCRAWEPYLSAFAQAGYRVVAPDQRGYGGSDKPQEVAAYEPAMLMNDILGLIDACGRARAHAVGHDWGAFVAWSLAIHHPDRLEKMVVMNVPHPHVMGRRLRRDPRQMLRSWYMGMFQAPRLPEFVLRLRRHQVLKWMLTGTSRANAFTASQLQHYEQAWQQPGALTGMLNWYRAGVRTIRAAAAAPAVRVHVPTLILWGKQDVALVPEGAQDSADLCDDVRIRLWESNTHWLHHERRHDVQNHILNFLATNRSPT